MMITEWLHGTSDKMNNNNLNILIHIGFTREYIYIFVII